MKTKFMRQAVAALVVAVALAPAALADPPSDKGKDANLPGGMSPDSRAARAMERDDRDRDDRDGRKLHEFDGYREDQLKNHGQAVSACNHRANQRNMKGQARREWVEWCVDRGERHKYDDRRYADDRSCYRKANERNLSGDFRRVFILDCLEREDKRREDREH